MAAVDSSDDICWVCQQDRRLDEVQWLKCGHWLHVVCAEESMLMLNYDTTMDILCEHCKLTGHQVNDAENALQAAGAVAPAATPATPAGNAADMVILVGSAGDDAGTESGAILDANAGAGVDRDAAVEETMVEEAPTEDTMVADRLAAENTMVAEVAAEENTEPVPNGQPAPASPPVAAAKVTPAPKKDKYMSDFPLPIGQTTFWCADCKSECHIARAKRMLSKTKGDFRCSECNFTHAKLY